MQVLIERAQLLLKQEKAHITNRGINYVVGLVINITVLYITLKVFTAYWPEFILSKQDHKWEIYFYGYQGIVFVFHALNYVVYNLMDGSGWFDQYKITKTNLIWEVNPQGWRKLRNKALLVNFVNLCLITPTLFYFDSSRTKLSFSPEVPSFFTVVWQVLICMFLEAIGFYLFHRIGHEYLYRIHKLHHEFVVPTLLATSYFHPVDLIMGALIPLSIGPKLLGTNMHFLTNLIWGIWRLNEAYEGHSNYNIPWSPFRIPPFSASSEYHSFHHTNNVGNYGSTLLIEDTLTGTNVEYFKQPNSICYQPQTAKTA